MRTYVALGFAVISLLAARPTSAVAQDSVLAELYGHGVHAYYSAQYQQAHEYLTTAIDQGTRDPRAFYFRGLAYTRLGRPDEAKADFQKGSELETGGADRIYPVSHSLQRIQGATRITIERQRQQARLAARSRTVKASQARYEQLRSAEDQVLRNPNRPRPTEAKELVGTPPAEDETDPFGDATQPKQPEATPATTPTKPADSGTDLFGDPADAMPADDASASDADTDPFADDVPATGTEEAMPAVPEDDPFADPFADPAN